MTEADGGRFEFYDLEPDTGDMRADVLRGLAAAAKSVPPKYFYDERGSALFDRITELPEYYLTRTEVGILAAARHEIAAAAGERPFLIEYGSGSSTKIRLLLEALHPAAYIPVDISRDHLLASARLLAGDYPWLDVLPVCADFSRPFTLPAAARGHGRVAFFPGSSIGNFTPTAAVDFLRGVAALVATGGYLLIGVDRKKDPAVLERAYNDAAGVTAAFNLNMLAHINRVLDADFDLDAFRHLAQYDAVAGCIRMFLVSRVSQSVTVAGERFHFDAGERIHTESSHKYAREEFEALAVRAGFGASRHWSDADGYFSVFLLGS